jgi:DNA-binding NtrC family response regulator
MESELFGHVRHAFTGAGENKRGLMDLANGGTVFFDEIGDLPLEFQVKLLRLLQEREYRPVGSLQRVKVDVRVIAATNRNLQREAAAGRFREDLFHRLNVIMLTLPPLRERKEDIPILVERFLAHPEYRYSVTNEAMDAMMRYDWPGNIRELKNCIDRMIALNSGPLLHFTDLPSSLIFHARAEAGVTVAATAVAGASLERRMLQPLPVSSLHGVIPLQDLERQAIAHALQQTKGDRTGAALLLGIGRTTLYRKLKEYQMAEGA